MKGKGDSHLLHVRANGRVLDDLGHAICSWQSYSRDESYSNVCNVLDGDA